MTDKTPPYVTTFDQIKPGQLIEREWVFEGIRYRAEGIARHLSPNLGGEWCTADGGVVASDKGAETLRVLAEPPKPALPTEGYIEAWGTLLYSTVDVHLVIAKLNADGYWYGLTEDGNSYYLPADRITRWKPSRIVPADDPTAPHGTDCHRLEPGNRLAAFRWHRSRCRGDRPHHQVAPFRAAWHARYAAGDRPGARDAHAGNQFE